MLPPAHLFTVIRSNTKRLDRIKIIKGFHLKGHQLTAHLTDFFAVFSLLFNHKTGYQQHERCTEKGNDRHHHIIMKNHHEGCDELIDCDNDRRKPADGIAADCTNIPVKPIQYISVGIAVNGHPVRIYDFIENICLDIIVDIDTQLRRNPPYDTVKE